MCLFAALAITIQTYAQDQTITPDCPEYKFTAFDVPGEEGLTVAYVSSPLLTLVQHDAVTAMAIFVTAAILFAAWFGFLKIVRPKYPDRTGNGIAAGPIKVYDNRFLSIRLDELESNIGKLSAIDPDKLDENVGTTQAKVESTGEVGLTAGVNASGGGRKENSQATESPALDSPDPKLSQSARASQSKSTFVTNSLACA